MMGGLGESIRYQGRECRCVAVGPTYTADGIPTVLRTWKTSCKQCGKPFWTRSGPQLIYKTVHCPAHRLRPKATRKKPARKAKRRRVVRAVKDRQARHG